MHEIAVTREGPGVERRALLGGGVLAGLCSLIPARVWAIEPAADKGFLVLNAVEARIVDLLAEDMLPSGEDWPRLDMARAFDRHLWGFEADATAGLRLFVRLTNWMPLLAGFGFTTYKSMPVEHRRQYLSKLLDHDLYEVRNVPRAVQGMLQMIYFADPQVEQRVGYAPRCYS